MGVAAVDVLGESATDGHGDALRLATVALDVRTDWFSPLAAVFSLAPYERVWTERGADRGAFALAGPDAAPAPQRPGDPTRTHATRSVCGGAVPRRRSIAAACPRW